MRNAQKTSVELSPEVTKYLNALAKALERSRSWVVGALLRQHKKLHGNALKSIDPVTGINPPENTRESRKKPRT